MKRNVRNKKGDIQTAANNNIKMYENYLGRSVTPFKPMTSSECISRQISQCEEAFVVKAILVNDVQFRKEIGIVFRSDTKKIFLGGNSILKVLVWKRNQSGFLHFVDYFKVKPENGQWNCRLQRKEYLWERRELTTEVIVCWGA